MQSPRRQGLPIQEDGTDSNHGAARRSSEGPPPNWRVRPPFESTTYIVLGEPATLEKDPPRRSSRVRSVSLVTASGRGAHDSCGHAQSVVSRVPHARDQLPGPHVEHLHGEPGPLAAHDVKALVHVTVTLKMRVAFVFASMPTTTTPDVPLRRRDTHGIAVVSPCVTRTGDAAERTPRSRARSSRA